MMCLFIYLFVNGKNGNLCEILEPAQSYLIIKKNYNPNYNIIKLRLCLFVVCLWFNPKSKEYEGF